ncbi:kelch-like protein 10 [Neopsephotus bourkii]|uniref:kelch-like protein 10 n=1 Tax=Neopsephotus bourkii TaxID=309878 RepID=UPI002AA52D74|nr:kelch-like protein 10 [Neopsephotus bourkii]
MGNRLSSTWGNSSHMDRKMSATACAIFNELCLEGKLSDVIISVDGIEFNAHKSILCSCSPYFRALFASSWNRAEKTVYKIPGISPEMMRLIIEYAYTQTVDITTENVENLLIAADQFNVMGIVRLCCEFLESQLCFENCIGIYRLTEYYYCPELQEAAFLFILQHFEAVAKVSEEFLELSVSDLKNIIEKDELNAREEDAVFKAIVKWIDHDPRNRRHHIAELLSKVRLALMQAEFFMNEVKTQEYVAESQDCRGLIMDTLTEMDHLNRHGPSYPASTSPLSRPRLPYTVLFAVGGWNGDVPTNAMETYDVRADKWMNVTSEQGSPIASHGTVYLKGFIYVVGGFDGMQFLNSVKRFDPLRKTWHQVAPMHSRRCYVSVAILDGFIYAMGGFDGHTRLNTAERYEPETNQWTLVTPMEEQRSDASATTLHEKVYICGGFNGYTYLDTAEVYNASTGQWSFIAPMSSSRSGLRVIAYRNEVYAVGGCDGVNRLRSVEAYNPVNDTWHAVPPMFNPRSNFGIEVVEDFLYVVGGFNGYRTIPTAERYDEKANEWHNIKDMNIFHSSLSCCVVPGLSNIRDYVAKRDSTVDNPSNEVRFTSSSSSLPV